MSRIWLYLRGGPQKIKGEPQADVGNGMELCLCPRHHWQDENFLSIKWLQEDGQRTQSSLCLATGMIGGWKAHLDRDPVSKMKECHQRQRWAWARLCLHLTYPSVCLFFPLNCVFVLYFFTNSSVEGHVGCFQFGFAPAFVTVLISMLSIKDQYYTWNLQCPPWALC